MTLTIRRLPDDGSNEELIIVQIAIKGNGEVYQLRDYLQLRKEQLVSWVAPIGLYHRFTNVPQGMGLTFVQHPDVVRNNWRASVLGNLALMSTVYYNNDTQRIVIMSNDEQPNALNEVALDCTTMTFLIKVVTCDENPHNTGLHQS